MPNKNEKLSLVDRLVTQWSGLGSVAEGGTPVLKKHNPEVSRLNFSQDMRLKFLVFSDNLSQIYDRLKSGNLKERLLLGAGTVLTLEALAACAPTPERVLIVTATPESTNTPDAQATIKAQQLEIDKLQNDLATKSAKVEPTTKPLTPATATEVPVAEKLSLAEKMLNSRLSDPNLFKFPGKDVRTWGHILGARESTDTDQNIFVLGLTTKPEKPSDIGAYSSDPKKNQRLGHTKDVKYYDVENLVSNAANFKVGDLITDDGKLKMGGVVGEIQAASGMVAVLELVSENYDKYKDKTIAQLFEDDKFVAEADKRQEKILKKRVQFLGESQKPNSLEGMPAVLKDGPNEYATCEQGYVETALSKTTGKRSLGMIGVRKVTHKKGLEKTFSTANTEEEVVAVFFSTWGKVSGDTIATDRDFQVLIKGIDTEETRLAKDIQRKWSAEDYYQLCGTGPAAGKTPTPKARVTLPPAQGTPDNRLTPTIPGKTGTPEDKKTPTPENEKTPTPPPRTPTQVTGNTNESAPTAVNTAVGNPTDQPPVPPTEIPAPVNPTTAPEPVVPATPVPGVN